MQGSIVESMAVEDWELHRLLRNTSFEIILYGIQAPTSSKSILVTLGNFPTYLSSLHK